MTEYSKNSRNQRAQTGSRTGQRSKEGPTHPYSHDQSESPSQYSQPRSNREDTADEEMDYNFQISLQYIMPLISAVKSQNEHFKQQKGQMQGEMASLQKLSQGLLSQNQQLRRHYSARTNDIKKVVSTISINTNEQINDINHQSFLLREHNCALVKGIEDRMKRLALINANNTDKKRTLDSLTQENIQLQHAARDLAVKNRQLFLNCEQLRTQTNSIDTHTIDSAVNNLLADVVALRNTNKNNILAAKSLNTTYSLQKPEIEQTHTTVTEHNRKLELQANSLREALNLTLRQLDDRKQKSETVLAGLIETLKSKQKCVSQLSSVEQEVLRMQSQLQRSSIGIRRKHQQLFKLEKEKQQLTEQITSRHAINRQLEQQYRAELEKQDRNHKQTLAKMKAQLHEQEVRANEQVCSKVAPESTLTQTRLEESKEEFASLTQEVGELADKLARLDNPIKEILRLEYKVKKGKIFKQ